MATLQKFYFHDATTTNTGTLPGGTFLFTNPPVTASGASTNRAMDGTIGASQQSGALTTLANTSTQQDWFRRFISAPLADQQISASTAAFHCAASVSNTNSNFTPLIEAGFWRPSLNALATSALGQTVLCAIGTSAAAGTSETALNNTGNFLQGDLFSIAYGDMLVVEIYRNTTAQSMATAYTNTLFYDGTTEDSATTNAAYLDLGQALKLADPLVRQGSFPAKLMILHGRRVIF